MLVLTNLQATTTFSLVLRGKVVDETKPLFLVLTRQADFQQEEFVLTNTSTTSNWASFTIPTSSLPTGDYDVKMYNGDAVVLEQDCFIDRDSVLEISTLFPCDVTELLASLTVESSLQIGDGTPADLIWTAKGRVTGSETVFWVNESEPTYTVYEG